METNDIDSLNKKEQARKKYYWLTKRLWWCSGADIDLLDQCPEYDRAKYFGLGGIVLATGILAFLSSAYAIYIVFEPKEYATLDTISYTTVGFAVLIGLVWGAIIFNLERFIVSSTGKGDGTDETTKKEWIAAMPRIIMAVIISLVISKPLEIRIMKSEIDAELQTKQQEKLYLLNVKSDSVINRDLAVWEAKIAPLAAENIKQDNYFEKRRLEIKEQRLRLEDEANGKFGNPGRGPAWKDKNENLNKMEAELNKLEEEQKILKIQRNEEIEKYKKKITIIDSGKEEKHAKNIVAVQNMAGLLERLEIGHEIGFWVGIAIWLFFLLIETGPVIFKMMVSTGTYDHLLSNQRKLIEAENGIEVKEDFIHGGKIEVEFISHKGNKILAEKKELFDKQLALSKEIIKKWEEEQKKAIEKNPENFINTK